MQEWLAIGPSMGFLAVGIAVGAVAMLLRYRPAIRRLSDQLLELADRIRDREQQNTELVRKHDDLAGALDNLRQEKSILSEAERQLRARVDDLSGVSRELAESRSECRSLQAVADQQATEIARMAAAVDAASAQLSWHRSLLESQRAELTLVQDTALRREEELVRQASQTRGAHEARVEELREEFRKDLQQAKAALADERARQAQLRSDMQSGQDALRALLREREDDLAARAADLKLLDAARQTAQEQADVAAVEAAELRRSLAERTAELAARASDLELQSAARQTAQEQVDAVAEETAELRRSLAERTAELAALRETRRGLEVKLKASAELAAAKDQDAAALRASLDRQVAELVEHVRTIEATKQDVAQQRDAQAEKARRAEAALVRARRHRDALRGRLDAAVDRFERGQDLVRRFLVEQRQEVERLAAEAARNAAGQRQAHLVAALSRQIGQMMEHQQQTLGRLDDALAGSGGRRRAKGQPVAQSAALPARPIAWTPTLVQQFWDGVAQTRLNELSFARMSGSAMARVVSMIVPKSAKLLDFGGGDGSLARHLLEHGHRCAVFEPSAERREQMLAAMTDKTGFLGVSDGAGGDRFDAITMCEVFEHILEEEMPAVLQSIYEMLEDDGFLILTCPLNEDLEVNSAYCPVSGVLFHRWQHVRSVSPESLLPTLSRYGLEREWMGLVTFAELEAFEVWARANLPRFDAAAWRARPGVLSADAAMDSRQNIFLVCRKRPDIGRPDVGRSVAASGVTAGAQPHLPSPAAANPGTTAGTTARHLAGSMAGPQGQVTISGPFTHLSGHCYTASVPDFDIVADTMDFPHLSDLQLFEDGAPLGPGHAPHQEIADQGAGRYSHWSDNIYFSTSDNTDPNENDRMYSFTLTGSLRTGAAAE